MSVIENNVDQALKILRVKGYPTQFALGYIIGLLFSDLNDQELADLYTKLEALPYKNV